jgi:hypothetical protein
MPFCKAYGIPFAKYHFEWRFGNLNNFRTVKLNEWSPGREMTIFGRFGYWRNVLFPPVKPTAYRLQNINIERRFGNLKNFPSGKLNRRSPGREVTIFGCFRAWGSVLCHCAKPTAYCLQNINFKLCFGNLKIFVP